MLGSAWQARSRNRVGIVQMGIKAVENFNTDFELDSVSEELLHSLLRSDVFAGQVATQPGVPPDCQWEFSGMLFQPVPWSVNTKFGMPQEYEKYLQDKENYVVLNVPPNYMFQAKIFRPSRLCAIFQRKDSGTNAT
ncbi:hypothetical protein KFL_000280240 [Klebsormidium nitens]|uniref:Uncharacterized protein n=1 Tax=Klebsormidium nitens TaxID=105231 RepID=A0A1Y1HQ42_KLENI|nr:hypothetical protein KFL_000280240 [Klebsormidium nitens]|eukprot:GAQ79319.1 hypothetical protein KFL_000280240 [Klebsormidium nitens]